MVKLVTLLFTLLSAAPALAITADEFLTEAIRTCRADLVQEALTAGANVNLADATTGNTPLMLAYSMRCTSKEIYTTLIKGGANVDAQNKSGATALHFAMETYSPTNGCKYKYTAPLFEAKANTNLADSLGETPIFKALESHRKNCDNGAIQTLILQGADVNVINKSGVSVLEHAVNVVEVDFGILAFRSLVEAGAQVSDRILYKLVTAFYHDGYEAWAFEDLIGLMLSRPVSITGYQDSDGRNVAHIAAQFVTREGSFGLFLNTKLVKLPELLSVKDLQGNTPLHLYLSELRTSNRSVGKSEADVVRAYVAAKADVNIRNNKGETTLTLAKKFGYFEIVWIIQQAGGVE